YQHAAADLDGYLRAFTALPGQAGAVFALAGRVVGLEVLYSPATFAMLLPKLIQSYALDAVEIPGDRSPLPPPDSAVSLLRQVAAVEARESPGIGLGQTLRLQESPIVGTGLLYEAALIHLAAFRTDGDGPRNASATGSGIQRASRRFRA
ncbi:MAG: DUF6569 family protein, partial [Candidatus Methylomirabilota bacterium]